MSHHPPYNKDEVVERLINENKQYLVLLNEIRLILCMENDFSGLSIVGGAGALMKKYLEAKDKIYLLEERIKKLEK